MGLMTMTSGNFSARDREQRPDRDHAERPARTPR